MNNSVITEIPYSHKPLELFGRIQHLARPILLDSTATTTSLGRYSFLSADPVATVAGNADSWPEIRERIRSVIKSDTQVEPGLPPFQGGWAGWFGYELGAAFDQMPRAARDDLQLPDLSLGLYDWVIAWDHHAARVWLISSGINQDGVRDEARARQRHDEVLSSIRNEQQQSQYLPGSPGFRAEVSITAFANAPAQLTGDFAPAKYRESVARVKEYVLAGDIFQANLTQRFVSPFTASPIALYAWLAQRNSAPMAALVGDRDFWIVSASPERFLRYSPVTRAVETRPIKGTTPRSTPDDNSGIASLASSEKDRAENVMIVDLLRNDLARVCTPGSVEVPSLCRVESYPTVHHLVSIVSGRLASEYDALDLFAATFPGGSITGAPKLRAMSIIAELEPVTRGVYCGAIGWIGLDGGMDTSIAIRTVTLRKGVAMVNVGGGITAQSEPESEYQETLDKAAALIAALEAVQ